MLLLFQPEPGFRLCGCIHFRSFYRRWKKWNRILVNLQFHGIFCASFSYFPQIFQINFNVSLKRNNIYQPNFFLSIFLAEKNKHRHHKFISIHYWRRGTHTTYIHTSSISAIFYFTEQWHSNVIQANRQNILIFFCL